MRSGMRKEDNVDKRCEKEHPLLVAEKSSKVVIPKVSICLREWKERETMKFNSAATSSVSATEKRGATQSDDVVMHTMPTCQKNILEDEKRVAETLELTFWS